MGSIISAHCDCGYNLNEMRLGGGMLDFTTNCSFPYYCEDCSILFEGNVLIMLFTKRQKGLCAPFLLFKRGLSVIIKIAMVPEIRGACLLKL